MLPFWIELGSLPALQLIPFTVAAMSFFLLSIPGLGSRP